MKNTKIATMFTVIIDKCKKNEFLFLLILSVIIRLFFIFSIGNCYALAPDEKDYLLILDRFFSADMWGTQLPTNGNPLIYYVWLLPAKILQLFTLPGYLCLRISSLVYITLSIWISYKVLEERLSGLLISKVLVVSTFIPTFFIYTSLGLRESFIIFLITALFFGLHKFSVRKSRFGLSVFFMAILLLSLIKWYLGIIIVSGFLFLILRKINIWKPYLKSLSIFFVIFIFSVSNGLTESIRTTDFTSVITKTETRENSINDLEPEEGSRNRSEVRKDLLSSTLVRFQECKAKKQIGFLGSLGFMKNKKDLLTLSANLEAFPATNFYQFQNGRSIINYADLPSAFLAFWFSPLLFSGGGLISTLSFEGFLWGIPILLVFVRFLFMRKREFDSVQTLAFFFILFYMIFCALTEVNLATSMRHRILLLFPIIFALSGKFRTFPRTPGNYNQ